MTMAPLGVKISLKIIYFHVHKCETNYCLTSVEQHQAATKILVALEALFLRGSLYNYG